MKVKQQCNFINYKVSFLFYTNFKYANKIFKPNTINNRGLTLTLALNYGAKQEIVNAVKIISKKIVNNEFKIEEIDEKTINSHLYTFTLPVVDFLIRTSGEKRISNFLLWQIAYAELYFTDVLWPDFRKEDFYEAVLNYQRRERRFGKTSEQIDNDIQ